MSQQSIFSTLKITAGSIEPINAKGRNFHVVFAPADVQVKLPGGEFGTYQQGSGIDDLPNGQEFSRLEVRNPTLGDILVTIYIGGPLYRDSRAALIEPRTVCAGQAATTLAGATGITLTGIPTGLRIRRKSIQVTNLDPNLNLQIRDGSANVVLTVFPNTSITLPISETVEVYNANGAPQALNISEIWWSL